ncbi:MAG: hypothetical protein KDJ77_02505 [Rhodobiaceae bacterium]|nr:hypothetical protein [Rhodobiaceae bacterium]
MSTFAFSLGSALGSIFHSAASLDVSKMDSHALEDLRLDPSIRQRAEFAHVRMGEPGATNAARYGLNGR